MAVSQYTCIRWQQMISFSMPGALGTLVMLLPATHAMNVFHELVQNQVTVFTLFWSVLILLSEGKVTARKRVHQSKLCNLESMLKGRFLIRKSCDEFYLLS